VQWQERVGCQATLEELKKLFQILKQRKILLKKVQKEEIISFLNLFSVISLWV
jgi:hypothetical protein